MRIANAIFAGSIAVLLTAPVLANNSNAQKTEEAAPAPACHASLPSPNGPATPLPCEEVGSAAQTSPHKSPARNATDENPRIKAR
jgi:hypothetical protein